MAVSAHRALGLLYVFPNSLTLYPPEFHTHTYILLAVETRSISAKLRRGEMPVPIAGGGQSEVPDVEYDDSASESSEEPDTDDWAIDESDLDESDDDEMSEDADEVSRGMRGEELAGNAASEDVEGVSGG